MWVGRGQKFYKRGELSVRLKKLAGLKELLG